MQAEHLNELQQLGLDNYTKLMDGISEVRLGSPPIHR